MSSVMEQSGSVLFQITVYSTALPLLLIAIFILGLVGLFEAEKMQDDLTLHFQSINIERSMDDKMRNNLHGLQK